VIIICFQFWEAIDLKLMTTWAQQGDDGPKNRTLDFCQQGIEKTHSMISVFKWIVENEMC
jgi:hypothetical protein